MAGEAFDILVTRSVKPEACVNFEHRSKAFVAAAQDFPGHLSAFLLASPTGPGEHGMLMRFQDRDAWQRFQSWDPYQSFVRDVKPLLAADPEVHELHGMEAWFDSSPSKNPPRWKMAVLTYIGVVVMVWCASELVEQTWNGAPHWPAFFLINAMVVISLTWFAMPVLTRIARPWLLAESASS